MKTKKSLLKKLSMNVLRQVFATEVGSEGGESNPAPAPKAEPTPQVNIEHLLANARKDEKDKLYPEIQRLKTQNEGQVTRVNELLLTIGEKDEVIKGKDAEIAKLSKQVESKTDSEEVITLKTRIAELEGTIAVKDEEARLATLNAYKDKKLMEANGELISELVYGATPEEIDASVEIAKAKYLEIVQRVQGTVVVTNKAPDSNSVPPVDSLASTFNSEVGAMNLSGVSLHNPQARQQYEEMRKQLGLA